MAQTRKLNCTLGSPAIAGSRVHHESTKIRLELNVILAPSIVEGVEESILRLTRRPWSPISPRHHPLARPCQAFTLVPLGAACFSNFKNVTVENLALSQ